MAHHVNKKLAEWVQGVSTEVGHEMISANEVNIEVNCKLLNEILSCRVKYLEVVNWVSTLSPDYYQKVLFCRPNYNGFKHL